MTDRIQAILKSLDLSPSQLADAISVQRSSLSHILSGRNKPSLDFVSKLLNSFPQVSPDWLIFGNGPMLRRDDGIAADGSAEKGTKTSSVQSGTTPARQKEKKSTEKEEPQPAAAAPSPSATSNTNGEREAERIILLFSDGTFRTYTSS